MCGMVQGKRRLIARTTRMGKRPIRAVCDFQIKTPYTS